MSDAYLLDTNIVIAHLRGDNGVTGRLEKVSLAVISVITYGELLQGALYSARVLHNVTALQDFSQQIPMIPCEGKTALAYGEISAALRKAGQPIPDNDLWIAATARQHNFTLVTRDRHFANIPGLRSEMW